MTKNKTDFFRSWYFSVIFHSTQAVYGEGEKYEDLYPVRLAWYHY